MKDLITTPQFSPDYVDCLVEFRCIINGVQRESSNSRFPSPWYCSPRSGADKVDQERYLKHVSFFSQFIVFDINEIIDKLCLKNSIKRSDLKLYRFIENKITKFVAIGTCDYHYSIDEIYYEVEFVRVREPIVSYLEQKFGLIDEVKMIKDVFDRNPDDLGFDDYLIEKSKQLLKLDLNKWLLNNIDGKKVKKMEWT